MRVLQLIHSNEAGGVEALADSIAIGLADRGLRIDTQILYPAFAVGNWAKLKGAFAASARVLRDRPDALLAYQSTASVLVGVVGRIAGCQNRIVHQTALPSSVHPLVRFLDLLAGSLGFYTINIANSAATANAYAGYPKRYCQAMRVIEHGIEALVASRPRADVLRHFRIPDDGPIVLNAGRLVNQKAQERAIRALPLLPGSRLVLAGGGPKEAEYRRLAAELGVARRTHFLGYLPRTDIVDLYGAADVFVFPSTWETFGLAAVEATMQGVPLVVSDLPVLHETLSAAHETVARFVRGDDPAVWAGAIREVVSDPKSRSSAIEFSAKMRDKYSFDRMITQYATLLTPAL